MRCVLTASGFVVCGGLVAVQANFWGAVAEIVWAVKAFLSSCFGFGGGSSSCWLVFRGQELRGGANKSS